MKTKKLTIPEKALRFSTSDYSKMTVNSLPPVVKEDGGEETVIRQFDMVVDSGAIVKNHWYWGNWGIELSGLRIARQDVPALRQHEEFPHRPAWRAQGTPGPPDNWSNLRF